MSIEVTNGLPEGADHSVSLELSLAEAEAVKSWLLKPSADGSAAIDDEPDADEAALERTRTSYADLVEQVTDARPEPEVLAELGAYGMAATLDIAPSAKQALLELRSEPARLEQLDALFAEALQRIRTATRVAEQASGNGHLRPGE